MKIFDITQELFHSEVYPGDVPPTSMRTMDMENGDSCNLTVLNMCVHNGTHIDAPNHFYKNGKTIEHMELNKFIGNCSVVDGNQIADLNVLKQILEKCEKKLLIKGHQPITLEMARLFTQQGIHLVGIEGQSVDTSDTTMEVHLELLGKEVVIVEGLRLGEVPAGNYFLTAAPLKLGGSEGAPCRAVLVEF